MPAKQCLTLLLTMFLSQFRLGIMKIIQIALADPTHKALLEALAKSEKPEMGVEQYCSILLAEATTKQLPPASFGPKVPNAGFPPERFTQGELLDEIIAIL